MVWDESVTDIVDHDRVGRIGLVTLAYPSGHRSRGFLMAKGPRIEAHSDLTTGHVIVLTPIILDLMRASPPSHLVEKSSLKT